MGMGLGRMRGLLLAAVAGGMLIHGEANSVVEIVVESRFETDAEGWGLQGKATGPFHQPTNGNPDGHINCIDGGTQFTNYFRAPAKFLGDQSGSYGLKLKYDVAAVGDGKVFRDVDVFLGGDGLQLQFQLPKKKKLKKGKWNRVTVVLKEKKWRISGSNAKPTREQFEGVLANIDEILIRGEYILGPETFALDNVTLEGDVPVCMAR